MQDRSLGKVGVIVTNKFSARILGMLILIALIISLVACDQAMGTPHGGMVEYIVDTDLSLASPTDTSVVSPYQYPAPLKTSTPYPYPYPASVKSTIRIGPPPTPEPTPTTFLEVDRIVKGSGDFPGMYFVAPASDGMTAALYWVEGNTAHQVAIFYGHAVGNQVLARSLPDGSHLAVLFPPDRISDYYLEVVDLRSHEANTLMHLVGDLQPEIKNSDYQAITSFVWADNQHILYSKVWMPGEDLEATSAPDKGVPLDVQGEIWTLNIQSKEQQRIISAPLYRLIGISDDGRTYFVSGLLERWWRESGLANLRMD